MKRSIKVKLKINSKKLKNKEYKIKILRSVFSELRLNSCYRYYFYKNLKNLNLNRTKMNFYCSKTSQNKGLVSFVNTFRMVFRENVSFANYSGIKKSSW